MCTSLHIYLTSKAKTLYLSLEFSILDLRSVTSASNSHFQIHRSHERSSLSSPLSSSHSPTHRFPERSSLSRSQSPEFWSPVHTAVCHFVHLLFGGLFISILVLLCIVVLSILTNNVLLPIWYPVINLLPDLPDYVISLSPCLYCYLFGFPVYDLLPVHGPCYLTPPVVLY